MTTEAKEIIEELRAIKPEIDYIKKNMLTKDLFLTAEEKKLLEESYKNEKEGKLLSNKQLRKVLNI